MLGAISRALTLCFQQVLNQERCRLSSQSPSTNNEKGACFVITIQIDIDITVFFSGCKLNKQFISTVRDLFVPVLIVAAVHVLCN